MKTIVQPRNLPDPRPRYSHGILAEGGRLLFIAGQTAIDENGKVVGKGDIEAQTRQVFKNLAAVLERAGGTLDDLVMTTTYLTDRKYREGYNRVRLEQYRKDPPTSTLLIVSGLAHEDYLIEISGIAVL
ncbi:MAG TPA: RidA family protein [candidate division Zixibacteria bacterium]|nr:RidA family protein [candidate division Zixibacteria bacterium]